MIELDLKKERIDGIINTIYFGGGTPSLLDYRDINLIINKIYELFDVNNKAEITLEANPDDLSEEYLLKLKQATNINRLSIGVQSFIDEELIFLGRRHNSAQAIKAIRKAQEFGFENITIDLIYGIPATTNPLESLKFNLDKFFSFGLNHLSAYNLTIEENTRFGLWQRQGRLKPIDEDVFVELFEFLVSTMEKKGFLHYEISNFAKAGYISRHNFSYWTGEQYLGLGPAAHSFDGQHRYWNEPNLTTYLKRIERRELPENYEILSERDKFNEYILTGLRTYLGINSQYLMKKFPKYWSKIQPLVKQYSEEGFLKKNKDNYILTLQGKIIADTIIANLFI